MPRKFTNFNEVLVPVFPEELAAELFAVDAISARTGIGVLAAYRCIFCRATRGKNVWGSQLTACTGITGNVSNILDSAQESHVIEPATEIDRSVKRSKGGGSTVQFKVSGADLPSGRSFRQIAVDMQIPKGCRDVSQQES